MLLENLARAGPRFAQDEALAEEVAHGRRRTSGLVCPRPPVKGAPLRLLRRCHGDIALARKRLEVESLTIKKPFYQGEVNRSLLERAHQFARVARQEQDLRLWARREVRSHEPGRGVVGDGPGASEPERCLAGVRGLGGEGTGLDGKPRLIVFHGEESLVEQVRGSSRFDAATRLDEQRATVMGFHLANVLRCGGLRDEQVLRGAREAALAVDL